MLSLSEKGADGGLLSKIKAISIQVCRNFADAAGILWILKCQNVRNSPRLTSHVY